MAAPEHIVVWGDAGGDTAASGSALAGWSANAAEGSRAELALAEDGALRFSFALGGPGSFAIARRSLAAEMPEHWVARLRLRGEAPPLELQLKLVGAGGENVWWWRLPGFAAKPEAQELALRRARLEFAWGPASGGEPRRIEAIELAVAGSAARGALCVEALRIEARAQGAALPSTPAVRASSELPGCEAGCALAPDAARVWRPRPDDAAPWLELDLGGSREWGGLAVDFAGAAPAARLLASADGRHWTETAAAPAGGAPRRWLRGIDEGRFVRLALAAPAAVSRVALVPLELAASPVRYAEALARRERRGLYPRHLLGEHAGWALVAADADPVKALLGADGSAEVAAESFSIEPFLWHEGALSTWAELEAEPSLADGSLPVPSLAGRFGPLFVRITAFAFGAPGASGLGLRYALSNSGPSALHARLFLAIRPFQVTPPWQRLALSPAFAPIERIEGGAEGALVGGAQRVAAVTRADGFGATASDAGPLARFLERGALPASPAALDALGFAEAAFAWDLALEPGEEAVIALALPQHAASLPPPSGLARAAAAEWIDARLAETEAGWRARLAAIPIELPPAAQPLGDALRASVGWILANREGPRIQPGPRCYRRSWIRDGALTGSALVELGFAEESRAFLRWYAPHQHPDGRVPCAIERDGSLDLAVEHDSHGELIWAIAEVWRLTGDRAFLAELWPNARAAARALEALRGETLRERARDDPRYGLLPKSISHEGYASEPAHSYWDDFFALRGLADAAEAAEALGERADAERLRALRAAMAEDVRASVARVVAQRGFDFVPGSAELGDFDPTSTAIAFDPCNVAALLPPHALRAGFERYLAERAARRRGGGNESYSPYEVRNATALVRLGWKDEALALLGELLADQRPRGWRQWPEVCWRDPRAPRFLGDLPHGWVASSFLRSLRRLLADEREDGSLVLAAGVPESWLRGGGAVRCRALPTHYGALDLSLRADGDAVRVEIGGALRRPPGGVALVSPLDARRVAVEALPAQLTLRRA